MKKINRPLNIIFHHWFIEDVANDDEQNEEALQRVGGVVSAILLAHKLDTLDSFMTVSS